MKIHIIGCSGSGKTYLADLLSLRYGIPHFDLDDIQWDQNTEGYGVKMPAEKRTILLQQILLQQDWIIEGVYYAWVQQCFQDADRIYVLDMPKYLYKIRILKRSVKRLLGIEKGKKETLKSIYALLKWTDIFQKKNLKEIREILEKYTDKVVWVTSKKELNTRILGEIPVVQMRL